MIYHSSEYNLKTECPNYLLYTASRYVYIDKAFTLDSETKLNHFAYVEGSKRLPSLCNFLAYSILLNLFKNNVVIKKDVEDYFNTQVLNFLRNNSGLAQFNLKELALTWNSISKAIDLYINQLKSYDSLVKDYDIYWSDYKYNYKDNIPVIGIKEEKVTLFFILQYDLTQHVLQGLDIDYLQIPSMIQTLNTMVNNFDVYEIKILWMDISDIKSKYKFISYKITEDIISYIKDRYGQLTNREGIYVSTFKNCHSCAYLSDCKAKNKFYKRYSFKRPSFPKTTSKVALIEEI